MLLIANEEQLKFLSLSTLYDLGEERIGSHQAPGGDGRFLFSTGHDMTARLWDISASNPMNPLTMFGHEHINECCSIAPPALYQHLAQLAGLKKTPPTSNAAEFIATGSRDKTIKI